MDVLKVFDAWVDVLGQTMHFDVMPGDQVIALKLANEYVATLGYKAVNMTAEECLFCHQEPLGMFTVQQQQDYRNLGGFIVSLPS
jgi:hypothetical protein